MKLLRAIIAGLVCKAVHALIRLFNRGGTAFPGRLALKICPEILEICSRDVSTVAITGTNGKTTSARMAETAFRLAGYDVFANRSGANLIDGITCEFILNTDLFLKPKCRYAVIECDEAATRQVIGKIRPEALLVTNLFRDQLDRYGTVLAPRDAIADALKTSPETVAVLNADCQLASSIGAIVPNKTVYYGFDFGGKRKTESGESSLCVFCGAKLKYSYITYANLGGFFCPACGDKRHETAVSVSDILSDGSFVLSLHGEKRLCRAALDGMYNVYNAAGVIALATASGLSADSAIKAVSEFECGFGRMESFALGKSGAKMILIKNAAAADQTLEYIKTMQGRKTLVFVINDRPADGTDTSWIFDVDTSKLSRLGAQTQVYASGDKAELMANYLEDAGIACETVTDYDILLRKLANENSFIYILPTYTAMLELRQRLVKMLGGRNFWE